MKGKIKLSDFFEQVKKELIDAKSDSEPFYALDPVELEISFVVKALG